MLLLAAAKPPKAPDLMKPAAIDGLIHILLAFWPLWLLMAVIGAAKLAHRRYRMRRLARSGINEIDAMDGRAFELFLSTLFRNLGYGVELTRYRGDYGADLVVKKDGRKIAVQAKRWKRRVGLKAVQEAVAAKAMYGCESALVVANREFTQQARRLARANQVELWDREALISKLLAEKAKSEDSSAPAKLALETTPAAPETARASTVTMTTSGNTACCATCGSAVSEKVRDYCLARPARFGGLVYCFNHQRHVRPALAE